MAGGWRSSSPAPAASSWWAPWWAPTPPPAKPTAPPPPRPPPAQSKPPLAPGPPLQGERPRRSAGQRAVGAAARPARDLGLRDRQVPHRSGVVDVPLLAAGFPGEAARARFEDLRNPARHRLHRLGFGLDRGRLAVVAAHPPR